VAITATVDQPLRLKNPFGRRPYRANFDVRVVDDELQRMLKTGQTLQLRAAASFNRDPE
jgi:hypothetical protein